jgi:hypothetical protein
LTPHRFTPWKELARKFGGRQSRYGHNGDEKNPYPYRESNHGCTTAQKNRENPLEEAHRTDWLYMPNVSLGAKENVSLREKENVSLKGIGKRFTKGKRKTFQ